MADDNTARLYIFMHSPTLGTLRLYYRGHMMIEDILRHVWTDERDRAARLDLAEWPQRAAELARLYRRTVHADVEP